MTRDDHSPQKPEERVAPNEEETIRNLKAGDIAAFEQILLSYEKRIYGFLRRIVASSEDAEDLTQETFIKVFKKRGLIDDRRSFKSWLYKVATNTAYDFLRKKQRQVKIADSGNNKLPETFDAAATYQDTGSIDDNRKLERGLAAIKPIYRTVLLLFYREDMAYKDIAEAIDAPVNTVKVYIHRARKELKEALEKDNGTPRR